MRRSPAAPRRQATVSGELRKRSSQPSPAATVTPAGAARLGATRAAASQATTPAATTAATRQGRLPVPATKKRRRPDRGSTRRLELEPLPPGHAWNLAETIQATATDAIAAGYAHTPAAIS